MVGNARICVSIDKITFNHLLILIQVIGVFKFASNINTTPQDVNENCWLEMKACLIRHKVSCEEGVFRK